jgi:hypothetical protein
MWHDEAVQSITARQPDVTRTFPSDWRSMTIVGLSPVASLSKAFWCFSELAFALAVTDNSEIGDGEVSS